MTFRFCFSYYLTEKKKQTNNLIHGTKLRRKDCFLHTIHHAICSVSSFWTVFADLRQIRSCISNHLSKPLRTQIKKRFLKKRKVQELYFFIWHFCMLLNTTSSFNRITILIQFSVAEETPSGQMISSNGINKNLSTCRIQKYPLICICLLQYIHKWSVSTISTQCNYLPVYKRQKFNQNTRDMKEIGTCYFLSNNSGLSNVFPACLYVPYQLIQRKW